MRNKIAVFASALVLSAAFARAENILSNTDHIAADAAAAVTILGGTVGPGGTAVDQNCASGSPGCSTTFLPYATIIALSQNTGATLYLHDSATPTNHAPYSIINQSSTGYTLAALDQTFYATLTAADQIYMQAFCGTPQAGDYPPLRASTILPSSGGIPNVPNGASGCGYGTGIEFSMTPGYKGFDTGSPSGTTEAMSGLYSVLKTNHPTWAYADIKGALRQTTDSWSAGYASYHASPLGFGYGNVNYDAANAVSGPSAIYLQPPGVVVQNHGYYATFIIYPFMTTRRAKEAVYVGGTWPAASSVNELTAAQIAATGATKILDDGGASGPITMSYAPSSSGAATFTVLTLDASGNGSRVESYSQSVQSFVVGVACFN